MQRCDPGCAERRARISGRTWASRIIGEGVRFPDALITCTKFPGTERLAPDVVVVFEVLSPELRPPRPDREGAGIWRCRVDPALRDRRSHRQGFDGPASPTRRRGICHPGADRGRYVGRCRRSAFPCRLRNFTRTSTSRKPAPRIERRGRRAARYRLRRETAISMHRSRLKKRWLIERGAEITSQALTEALRRLHLPDRPRMASGGCRDQFVGPDLEARQGAGAKGGARSQRRPRRGLGPSGPGRCAAC